VGRRTKYWAYDASYGTSGTPKVSRHGGVEKGKDGGEKEGNVEGCEREDEEVKGEKKTRECKTEQPNGTQRKYHGAGEYGEKGLRNWEMKLERRKEEKSESQAILQQKRQISRRGCYTGENSQKYKLSIKSLNGVRASFSIYKCPLIIIPNSVRVVCSRTFKFR